MLDRTKFLSTAQLAERYGRRQVAIRRWAREGKSGFPKPIYIYGMQLWEPQRILDWEASMGAAHVHLHQESE